MEGGDIEMDLYEHELSGVDLANSEKAYHKK
jgi:hypothetical protein